MTQTTSCKCLGITIDESLSWNKYILNINSKFLRVLFVIKQVQFIWQKSLHTLYYSLLHPHITYGILACGNAKASLCKTQILQKRSLGTIHNKKKSFKTVIQIHFLSNLVSLRYLTYIKLRLWHSCMTLQMKNYLCHLRMFTRLNYNIHGSYETRQAHLLHIPRTKSQFVNRLPLYQFPEIWNKWHKQLNVYTSRSGIRQAIKLLT